MTTDDEGVVSTFGWCQSRGRPDQFHNLCHRRYKSAVGVLHVCGCPEHANDAQEESAD